MNEHMQSIMLSVRMAVINLLGSVKDGSRLDPQDVEASVIPGTDQIRIRVDLEGFSTFCFGTMQAISVRLSTTDINIEVSTGVEGYSEVTPGGPGSCCMCIVVAMATARRIHAESMDLNEPSSR